MPTYSRIEIEVLPRVAVGLYRASSGKPAGGVAPIRTRIRLLALLLTAFAVVAVGPAALADGPTDSVGVVDQDTGLWYLRDPTTGGTTSFYYGNPGDQPIVGDWDCDGVDTPGLRRQSDGFVYLRNANTQGIADIRFFFGNPGDIALAGDFNGNGCATISIYRPSEGRVFIINTLGENNGGLGAAEVSYYFGKPGDRPFVGDFDGDGVDTIGLHRDSTGLVYFRNSHTQGIAEEAFLYGNPGDQILAAEWAESGELGPDTVGVFRPVNGTFYLRYSNTQGNADDQFTYGNSSMASVAGSFGPLPGGDPHPPGSIIDETAIVPPPNFKVAFIGDQGHGRNATTVLELIRDEGADMALHQGDFDYSGDPDAWDGLITDVLGADFPYFASVGNHDTSSWPGYQTKLYQRLSRVPEASCTGDLGVQSSCTFNGLFFILSGVGTMGSGHETYIRDQLALTEYPWRICSWHKNQQAMQVGGKDDKTGWGVYEACRDGGAIIATAHEHSYERTKTLVHMETQTVDPSWPQPDEVRVARGSTFVFVSGLGGQGIRSQQRCLPATSPYGCNGEWASIYTSNQGAKNGALFCSFNVNGQTDTAECYFRAIDGNIPDQFSVTNHLMPEP